VGKHNFSYQSMEVLRYWTHSSTLRGSQLNEETAGSKLGTLVTYLSYYSQCVEGPSVFGIEPGE